MLLQPKKLKVDKKFQPLLKDLDDEFYPNGIFEFNITKLLMFIKANPQISFLAAQPTLPLWATYRLFMYDYTLVHFKRFYPMSCYP